MQQAWIVRSRNGYRAMTSLVVAGGRATIALAVRDGCSRAQLRRV